MKTIIIIVVCLALGFGLAQLFMPSANQAGATDVMGTKQQYTCGMHPEIISDEPGYCPICGMKLTPKKDGGSEAGSIIIDPTTRQNMGLVSAPAEYRKLSRTLRAFGTVEYSEPKIHTVSLKIDAWIEKLYVDYEGARVEKGRPLVEIYSPELVAAQKEFLIALKSGNNGDMAKLLEGARQRLLNWDISSEQIDRLAETGEIRRNMVIKSPASGVVVFKNVETGDHLKPGAELYRLADISSVWVIAHIYEQDVPFVALDQEANISFPNLGGKNITAKVSFISPFLDSKGQTEIRLDVPNPGLMLKPEMYAEVTLKSEMPEVSLTLPRSAVINSGARQLVYTASMDGSYAPRIITTGVVGDDDMVEIKSGLKADEWVVTRGQFLLDSESRLSEALAGGHDHQSHTTFASERKPILTPETGSLSGIYTCPMPEHFHVLQYGEGNCPECGMKLVPVEETGNIDVYVCPMSQCGVAQNEAGSCPVCGMDLVKIERMTGDDQ
jgi:multidrug efflux pump subunit AcrA (membrane-fusion protein)